MRQRERDKWMQLLADEREAHRKERQELLNRLAQPETRVVDSPSEPRVAVPPRDALELAFVGREVPDGISVGSIARQEQGE